MSGSNTRDIRTKMDNVRKVRKITSAMQNIALARLAQARKRAQMIRPYGRYIRRMAGRMAQVNRDYLPPLMTLRQPARRIGILVVTTDKGLCGSLNNRLLSECLTHLQTWKEASCEVSATVVGMRGVTVLGRADIPLAAHVFCGSEFCYSEEMLGTLSTPIMQFVQGEIDELYVATNRFVNTLKYEPVIARFLPLIGKLQGVPPELQPEPRSAGPRGEVDFVYEPGPEAVVDAVLQRYMETVLFQAVAENAACEQAARLTAMRAATDNADNLLEELTLHYHKARQEAITRELIEIVSGAAATDER